MGDTTATIEPLELDPFALPQETRGRFRMFIAAAVVFAWSLGSWWVEVPNLYTIDWRAEPELQKHFDRLKESLDWKTIDPEAIVLFRKSRLFRQVTEFLQFQIGRIPISICITALCGMIALTLYCWHPVFVTRRYRITPLEAPEAAKEMSRLSAIAGIDPPRIAIKPGFLDGLAFGRKGREVLALGGPCSIFRRRWTRHTRAVVLHEMAHLVNGDIRTRVGSSSVWIALTTNLSVVGMLAVGASFLLLGKVQIPVFRPSFLPAEAEPFLVGGETTFIRTLVLLLVVWWLWSELVRAREFYADARVATWGFREPLLETLRLGEANAAKKRFGQRHPPHIARIQHLENSGKLFHVSRRLSFLTGLLLALVGAQMTPLSTDMTFILMSICTPLVFLLGPVALLVLPAVFFGVLCLLAYLVTGALGTQVQRETIAELATTPHHRWGYLGLLRTAVFFALGLETGLLLSPFNPFSLGRAALWVSVWLFVLTFLVWLWLVFLKGATRFFLGASPTPAHGVRRLITVLSTVLLAALLGSALVFRLTIEAGYSFDRLSELAPKGTNPVEFFVMMFLMSSLFLLVGALALYLTVGFLTILAATLQLLLRRAQCLRCGDPATPLLLVGRRCRACKAPLAPWPFLGESS